MVARFLGVLFTLFIISHSAVAQEVTEKMGSLTLNANLIGVTDQTWPEELILITHGTLTHNGRSTYRDLQTLLWQNDQLPSLAINLSLGLDNRHGEYDCATPHRHKHTNAMKEIAFWLDWLKSKGVQKVTLVGHSRGGNQTAWLLSENPPAIVSRAVLLAPATWDKDAVVSDYEKMSGRPFKRIYQKAKEWVKEGYGDHLLKHVDFLYCKDTTVEASTFVDYYEADPRFDTPTLLKTIHTPVLVLIGSEDKVVPDLAEKMQAVQNPNVHIQTIEDAGHFFRDFALEDAAKAIAEFMRP